ncbi:TPA: NAD-dependent epimerase/dehydratase family protein [Stenotrophomonas maltophilia]|nr:NAD-dependent epimerase/dehydratase family protein [Stenotrophomonas sp.]HEL3783739.1 NAD-dependent epimerase/dehydratase family protein [Stenotrophomonas maltophilia]
MKALVIGGNGFIGTHLVRALCRRGDTVVVLDRFAPRADGNLAGVDYHVGDFHDPLLLRRVLPGVDAVYHLASCTVPSTADADPESDVQGNLLGTLALLATMREQGIRRICYFSSGGTVYGNPERVPVPESHALRPISSYGIVKVAIEQYLAMFQRQGWLDPVIIRPSNPYGPGQALGGIQGAVAVFLGKALAGQRVQIWGDGEIIRDYVYIDDVVDLAMLAVDSGKNSVFNVGSGAGNSLNALCDTIRRVTGIPVQVDYLPGRSFDVKAVVLDVTQAREQLGWYPRIDLEAGVRRTWQAIEGASSSLP